MGRGSGGERRQKPKSSTKKAGRERPKREKEGRKSPKRGPEWEEAVIPDFDGPVWNEAMGSWDVRAGETVEPEERRLRAEEAARAEETVIDEPSEETVEPGETKK